MYRTPRLLTLAAGLASLAVLAMTVLQIAGPPRGLNAPPGTMVRVRGRKGRWRVVKVNSIEETIEVEPVPQDLRLSELVSPDDILPEENQ